MNILFLTSAFPSKEYPKSNAHNFRSVLNLSKESQIEIQVVHLRSWRPWRKMVVECQLEGLDVISYSFPYYPTLPKSLLGILLNIYKRVLYYFVLKKNIQNINVIHTAGVSMESVVGSYISKKTGVKHVAQCMGGDVDFGLPKYRNTFGWKGFEKHVDVFCCNSFSLQRNLKYIFPLVNTKVIYRGVNLDEFDFNPIANIKYNDKTFKFLYLGGLQTNNKSDVYNSKGGVTLLMAWLKLKKQLDGSCFNVELLLAGPNVNDNVVIDIINENPIDLNIKIIGELTMHEVKKNIISSDVVILPSLTEGLPNVAMEAAAIGRPVIGSDVGGIPEIVIDGLTGFLFKSQNSNQLCNLIKYYITNPEKIHLHGKRARKHVEKNFDSKLFTEGYINTYSKLISKA